MEEKPKTDENGYKYIVFKELSQMHRILMEVQKDLWELVDYPTGYLEGNHKLPVKVSWKIEDANGS